ncbi:MAG: nucleotidyltransferase domain-containing protein [Proteobacteria bacterium]|nr:nucleotidyltransferase domain-containing protein [Pseudomonadota bacterium]
MPRPVFDRITNAYIFGSYARGTANETSDIDFLVDIEGSNVQM